MGPIAALPGFPFWMNLMMAFIIGIGFGFALEQAGFSSCRKLAGMFYGYDTTVIKVFFTAALVALIGSQFLGFFGLLNLNKVYVNEFYVYAAIVGGVIMGAGFIMGGYCPGTGIAALSIGKIDALFFLFGGFTGAFLFAETYPRIASLANGWYKGPVTINEALGLSPGVFTFLLVLAALVMFALAERAEKAFGFRGDIVPQPAVSGWNVRHVASIILLVLGGVLALMPATGKYSLHGRPDRLWSSLLRNDKTFTVDEVARFVVNEDSTIQLIDLRQPEEFRRENIPQSVNLPYNQFLLKDPEPYFLPPQKKVILYSNGDIDAASAQVLAQGMGFSNCYIMKGGMNEWFKTVMNSQFTGNTITARENALFETRMKARRMFTEINSLPDSLKLSYMASKRFDPKKLDGGCE
jgi:rhodanese-related sulfurtransferase